MTTNLALTDKQKVNDLADRIAEFLPQSRALPKDTRLTIAQIALAHRLDPFLGDIWAIPERNKVNGEWVTTGYRIMIGISAWRRSAHDTGEYWGRHFEQCTPDERKWLGAAPNDLAIKCIVYRRKTGHDPMEFDGYGIFRQGESSKMNPLQCVRLRAERDALKGAFPIGFGGGAVKIAVADDSGEEINGDIQHGPKWDVITTEPAQPPIEQVKAEPDTLDELTETVQRDAVTNAPAPEQHKTAAKKCTIKTANWAAMLARLQAKTTFYNGKDGAINGYHATGAAAKCGYSEVTDDNLEHVFNDLVQYALEQTIEAP